MAQYKLVEQKFIEWLVEHLIATKQTCLVKPGRKTAPKHDCQRPNKFCLVRFIENTHYLKEINLDIKSAITDAIKNLKKEIDQSHKDLLQLQKSETKPSGFDIEKDYCARELSHAIIIHQDLQTITEMFNDMQPHQGIYTGETTDDSQEFIKKYIPQKDEIDVKTVMEKDEQVRIRYGIDKDSYQFFMTDKDIKNDKDRKKQGIVNFLSNFRDAIHSVVETEMPKHVKSVGSNTREKAKANEKNLVNELLKGVGKFKLKKTVRGNNLMDVEKSESGDELGLMPPPRLRNKSNNSVSNRGDEIVRLSIRAKQKADKATYSVLKLGGPDK